MDSGGEAHACIGQPAAEQSQSVGFGDDGAALASPGTGAFRKLQHHQVPGLHACQPRDIERTEAALIQRNWQIAFFTNALQPKPIHARHRLLQTTHLLEARDAFEERLHVDGPVALVGIQPDISIGPGIDDGSDARGVSFFVAGDFQLEALDEGIGFRKLSHRGGSVNRQRIGELDFVT